MRWTRSDGVVGMVVDRVVRIRVDVGERMEQRMHVLQIAAEISLEQQAAKPTRKVPTMSRDSLRPSGFFFLGSAAYKPSPTPTEVPM